MYIYNLQCNKLLSHYYEEKLTVYCTEYIKKKCTIYYLQKLTF